MLETVGGSNLENKIIYRRKDATYNREKFRKPLIMIIILTLIFMLVAFNETLLPFAILGIMISGVALVILSLLYFNRPLKRYDKRENVYIQFKENSLKLSLRENDLLIGDMRKYLKDEVKYPKIKYQIFEIPYNKITSIKEYMSGNYGRPTYRIFYESEGRIMKPCVVVLQKDFDSELREWFAKLI
jgi:hypothetical protein